MGAALPGRPDRGIPGETGEPRGGRPGGGTGQVLLSTETLHQSQHKAEVGGLIIPLCKNSIQQNGMNMHLKSSLAEPEPV